MAETGTEAVIVSGPRKGQFISIDENGAVSEANLITNDELQMIEELGKRFLEVVTRLDERLAHMVATFEARGLIDAEPKRKPKQ